jgi:hypothetical protein
MEDCGVMMNPAIVDGALARVGARLLEGPFTRARIVAAPEEVGR